VSIITVDDASSNNVAIAYLKSKVKIMNGLIEDEDSYHMWCSPHLEFSGNGWVEK
jgi:hypothetical protein